MWRLWIWEVVSVKVHSLYDLLLMNYCPLAIIVDEQIRPACTASAVFAPELLFERIVRPTDPGSPPTQASDIWSPACTIYELMFGTRLFHLKSELTLGYDGRALWGGVARVERVLGFPRGASQFV